MYQLVEILQTGAADEKADAAAGPLRHRRSAGTAGANGSSAGFERRCFSCRSRRHFNMFLVQRHSALGSVLFLGWHSSVIFVWLL